MCVTCEENVDCSGYAIQVSRSQKVGKEKFILSQKSHELGQRGEMDNRLYVCICVRSF